jgi:ATP adenylyltransferase
MPPRWGLRTAALSFYASTIPSLFCKSCRAPPAGRYCFVLPNCLNFLQCRLAGDSIASPKFPVLAKVDRVDQERIWAPWRIGYVSGSVDEKPEQVEPTTWLPGADQTCFLCRAAADFAKPDEADHQQLVVWKGEHVLAMLNRYPYANGHLLVAPRRHVGELGQLTDAEHLEAMHQLAELTEKLRNRLSSEGFNVGLNLGRVAGAGVPGHLHWHLVPRWNGDHNFMPTLAGVKVIPQSLEAVWEALTH